MAGVRIPDISERCHHYCPCLPHVPPLPAASPPAAGRAGSRHRLRVISGPRPLGIPFSKLRQSESGGKELGNQGGLTESQGHRLKRYILHGSLTTDFGFRLDRELLSLSSPAHGGAHGCCVIIAVGNRITCRAVVGARWAALTERAPSIVCPGCVRFSHIAIYHTMSHSMPENVGGALRSLLLFLTPL